MSACAGAQQATPAGSALSSVTADKDCNGAGGVKVAPCPVRLGKHNKSGVVVTVSGPHVVNSYLGRINGCYSGKTCYNAERYKNSQLKWLITPGQFCGGADVEFDGVNKNDKVRGYYFLKVNNKDC